MNKLLACAFLAMLFPACTPLKSSPQEARLELKMRELQTNMDALKHDLSCYQTEVQMLDGRVKSYEHALAMKSQDGSTQQFEQLKNQVQNLEKQLSSMAHSHQQGTQELEQLKLYAKETSLALSQFKARLLELEKDIQAQTRRDKGNSEPLSKKVIKVRSGDTLEKIARAHNTTIEQIKESNHLDQDLIMVGQELIIP